jgi:hypothetical protein
MATVNEISPSPSNERDWNEAYDRLESFLKTFDLANHAYVSQLAVEIFQRAKERHHENPSQNPTALTIEQAQKRLTDWLAANLGGENKSPSHTLPAGTVALLLSQIYRTAPDRFLASPVPEELRQALQETLLVTGPDLNVSSMTPRHLDYGPMLQFARQTWHRWSVPELVIALAFWAGVYTVFYWWLSQVL